MAGQSKMQDSKVIEFLKEMKVKECIWNEKHTKHNPRELTIAWDDVARTVKGTKVSLQYKWRTLKRQMLQAMELSESEDEIIMRFEFYEHMIFMKEKIQAEIEKKKLKEQALQKKKGRVSAHSSSVEQVPAKVKQGNLKRGHESTSGSSLKKVSDEDYFSSLLVSMNQIPEEDKVSLRIKIMKLARYYTYHKD